MDSMSKEEVLGLVANLFETDRAAVTKMVRNATRDSCRTAAVQNNVTDLEERRSLFHDFVAESSKYGLNTTVTTLSIFLLCPIGQLRHQVAAAKTSYQALALFYTSLAAASNVVRSFLTKGKTSDTPASSAASTPKVAGVVVAQAGKESAPVLSSPLKAPPMVASTSQDAGPSEPKRKATSPPKGSPAKKKSAKEPAPTTPPNAVTSGPSTPPSQSPSTEVKNKARKHSATAAAYRRDKHVCVLSGYGYPDGAHVFPFSASKDRAATLQTLNLLQTFWGEEATMVWRAQCENAGITESPQNILCLAKHLHALWGAARFGLKPLRDPSAAKKNEVWVQFHWLRQGHRKPDDVVDAAVADQLVDQLAAQDTNGGFAESSSDGDGNRRGRNGTLAHRQSGLCIETGQVFVISADKPGDLPSLDLLELQWNLVRVAAMSGAADVQANSDLGDDDSADGVVGEVQVDDDVESLWLSEGSEDEEEKDADIEPLRLDVTAVSEGDNSSDDHDDDGSSADNSVPF